MELCREHWAYLRQLAGDLAAASQVSRGDYVHLDVRRVDEMVKVLREITDGAKVEPPKPKAATQAQRREKR